MNGVNIDEKAWEELPQVQRDRLIYLALSSIDKRLLILENRKWMHSSIAFIGGVVGGIAFQVGKVFK
jgi:hypothetical protein